MPIKFPIPHSCLLAQASIYVATGRDPIPDDLYCLTPEPPPQGPIDLVRALRAKLISARGKLQAVYHSPTTLYTSSPPMFRRIDWKAFSLCPALEEAEIKCELWSLDEIDFYNSSLFITNDAAANLYNLPPIDDEILRATIKNEIRQFFGGEDEEALLALNQTSFDTAFIFSNITVATADLFSLFPKLTSPSGGPQSLTISNNRRVKAAPSYERAKHIIDKIFPDGVPNSATVPNKILCRLVSAELKKLKLAAVSPDTILRAAGRRK